MRMIFSRLFNKKKSRVKDAISHGLTRKSKSYLNIIFTPKLGGSIYGSIYRSTLKPKVTIQRELSNHQAMPHS